MLGIIANSFEFLNEESLLKLYTIMVHSIVEYAWDHNLGLSF